jgi:NAD+ kinase
VDGTISRRVRPGEALRVRLRPRAGLVVRLDPERYQRRSSVKLSLLDLPFLPDEMRDLLRGGDRAAQDPLTGAGAGLSPRMGIQ